MGAAFAHLIPTLSPWRMGKPPTPTSPQRCLIELRAGSIQDSDLGFSHRMARAFGALRAAPLLSRTLRESDKIGESAWRLWRAHRVMGSTLDTCRFLGCRRVVWIKMLVRLTIWGRDKAQERISRSLDFGVDSCQRGVWSDA